MSKQTSFLVNNLLGMNKEGDKRERLTALINYFSEGNKSAFARMIGTRPQTINTWLARDTFDMELIYSKCDSVSGDWLISGNGDMIKSVIPQEHTYITHINQSKVSEKVEEVQYVPYYSFEATAGIFEQYDISEYEIGRIVVPRMPSCDGAISVTGDSMYPLIKSGDIVAFKLLNDISHIHYGDMYLVCLNEDGDTYIAIKWVKKHESDPQKAVLVSENPHHAPREVYLKDIHKIALIKFTIRYNNMG